jgi:hypothetical protein
MEPEGPLPHSQVPATYPHPEPARSSPHPLPENIYKHMKVILYRDHRRTNKRIHKSLAFLTRIMNEFQNQRIKEVLG